MALAIRITLLGAVLGACATAGKDQPNPAADAPAPPVDSPVEIDAPVIPPDANTCATQPCDILTQCGCGASMACDIDGSDQMGTACRTIFTPGTETSTCINATRCDAGFVCLFGAGSNVGTCKRYCDMDADCGTPRGRCLITIQANGTPIAGIPKACTSNCDPTNSAAGGCPSTHKCSIFTSQDNVNFVDCTVAGSGAQGANCKSGTTGDDKLCAVNHLCTTLDNVAFNCRKFCTRGVANTGCAVGQTCIGFDPAFTLAGVEYGVCN